MNSVRHWPWAGLILLVAVTLIFVYSPQTHTLPFASTARETALTASAPRSSLQEATAVMDIAGEDPEAGDLRSLSAPLAGVRSNVGSASLSSLSDTQASLGGLTVSAVGSVSLPADEAYVILVPEQYYGPAGPEQVSSEDRKDVIESLANLGIEEEAIEFTSLRRYEPTIISVELELDAVREKGDQVVEAVEDVVRRVEAHGVRYTLSAEKCGQALAMARRQAIPGAKQAADDLADAFDVVLGSVTRVMEYPLNSSSSLVRNHADACSHQGSNPYDDFARIVNFDSEPEVEVSVGLQVTYSIQ